MAKSEEFIKQLWIKANEYIDECVSNTRTHVAGSGKVVKVEDRHIPTVKYFLNYWMPRNHGESITRETYYTWLRSDNELKTDTIKSIQDLFGSVAEDIVANEGKGIFYAKNRLGMHDKQHIEQKNVDKFDFDND